jgi:hypothetical protein
MVANPTLTARVIPALFDVQILGFIALAFTFMANKTDTPSKRS